LIVLQHLKMNKMKKITILIIGILALNTLNAQEEDTVSRKESDSIEVNSVRIPASFPGGVEGWNKYLQKNLRVEETEQYVKIPKGQKIGRDVVVVTFLVNKDGSISDVKVENKPHPKLAKEAIRVVAEGPNWIPAELNGQKVKFRHKQSITWEVAAD
jgi:protein TonB